MITEDFVSFETAKFLKEKGFGGECSRFYMPNEHDIWKYEHYHDFDISDKIECPTIQMAMKWLREVHNLFIQICIIPHTTITMEQKYYLFTIHRDRRTLAFRKDFPSEHYFTYEEAAEAAIKYCLENLI